MIQAHRNLCGPLQPPALHPPSSQQFIRQNRCRQTCLQDLCHQARHKNSALSLQQWLILQNAFKQACHKGRQQLTFCGVNAHFQNGIAKCSIRDLSESVHKQLLHACTCWPQAVHFVLWPYALCNVVLLHNSLPVLEDGTSR